MGRKSVTAYTVKVLPLIPKPVKVERLSGEFILKDGTPLVLPVGADAHGDASARIFADKIKARFGVTLALIAADACVPGEDAIILGEAVRSHGLPDESAVGPVTKEEGYELTVGSSILIRAWTSLGVHNALMSLLQLVEGSSSPPKIPAVRVIDCPRFRWRGMLIDPARNFLSLDVVKRYIDYLSELKLNVLHWHLVDDQGWRIESKSFPRLHQVGGQNGYYTQDEIRELVAYAQERHVMVVPEIDMPGHTSALLAAYPYLSCSGKEVPVRKYPGVYSTALCPAKEEVYEFLDRLFGEIKDLFPAPYVHIGSDEVRAKDWLNCPPNKKLLAELGYPEKTGLQRYFVTRVNQILRKYGKTMIGWDEITAYLPEGSVVQAWRRHRYAREAALAGHDAIVSPVSHCYIDYPLLVTSLKKVYAFEPIPPHLDPRLAQHILGGEINLWGEWVKPGNIDRKAFPRLIAHAEVLWSPAAARDWDDFAERLQVVRAEMQQRGVEFGKPWQDPLLILWVGAGKVVSFFME